MILWGRSSSMRGERIWHVALPWLLAASGFAVASVAHSDARARGASRFGMTGIYAAFGPFFSLPSSFLRGAAAAGGIGLFNAIGNFGGFSGPYAIGVLKEGNRRITRRHGSARLAVALVASAIIVLALGRAMAPQNSPPQRGRG